jgi:hypothetical protein
MSSLDMVSYINSTREPYAAELRHDSFMAKVPSVLGVETAPKFIGLVLYSSGNGAQRQQQIYNFPKREAMLMAMSYSYKLQAKVFDAWEAAEATRHGKGMARIMLHGTVNLTEATPA